MTNEIFCQYSKNGQRILYSCKIIVDIYCYVVYTDKVFKKK